MLIPDKVNYDQIKFYILAIGFVLSFSFIKTNGRNGIHGEVPYH